MTGAMKLTIARHGGVIECIGWILGASASGIPSSSGGSGGRGSRVGGYNRQMQILNGRGREERQSKIQILNGRGREERQRKYKYLTAEDAEDAE